METNYKQDKLTEAIIGAILKVHRTLGPGFLESIYRKALILELNERGIRVETEKKIKIYYAGEEIGEHRLDLLVEGRVILELKTVEELSFSHYCQVRSYLKATSLRVALLVNFATAPVDIRRVERKQ
jgi:GxxExxY protein